jgi:RHS repeat-associated protein
MVSNKTASKIERKAHFGLSNAQRELLRPFFVLCTVLCELFVLAAVPGCDDPEAREVGAVAAQGAALTLADVLPGKIVPASGVLQPSLRREIVGATAGKADVDPFGAMSYDVPIWVPDGMRGMQPRLSVAYRSNGDVGLLGQKWDLSGFGLSVIRRCRKTDAHDGVSRPVDFENGDTYCLDGERLVRVTGSPNGPGEFRTQVNPFAKIVAVSAAGIGGLSFRVFQPDGRIFHYGRTDASRLWGNPIIFPNPGMVPSQFLPRRVAAYYVDKIEDRYGNSILVSYINQPTLPPGGTPPIATQSPDDLLPNMIQWGNVGDTAGQRSIKFEYYPPAGGHNVAHQRYFGGLGLYLGQGLKALKISGPDGLGSVPLLKVYNFSYSAPTITGESLLSEIQECDGNDVCKRATKIKWEPGSLLYDSGTTLPELNDVLLSGYSAQLEGRTVGPNEYRRIQVADFNNDGRDDILYRTRTMCLDWAIRFAQPGGTFGFATTLGIASENDPRCLDPLSTFAPFPGDPVIADLNLDGFPDIAMPVGDVRFVIGQGTVPVQKSYRVYFNKIPQGGGTLFTPRADFEAPYDYQCTGGGMGCAPTGSVDGTNAAVAIGDVGGDLLPEFIRPLVAGSPPGGLGKLWAANLQQCTSPMGCGAAGAQVGLVTVPDVAISQQITGFTALDLDGDGISEILRDLPPSTPSGAFTSMVTSPTMNGTLMASPTNTPFMKPQTASPPAIRWALDLNGDGLKDLATVFINDPDTMVTNINNGKGFNANRVQTLPPFQQVQNVTYESGRIGAGWRSVFDAGARVVDYNLDGRDDLLLIDRDPFTLGGGQGRFHQMALLSDGTGGFTGFLTNNIPIGDPADGWSWFTRVPNTNGYRTSVALDYNGDGLPDFLQIEGGVVKLYKRLGKMPDMVTEVAEGTGRKLTIDHTSVADNTVYTPDHSLCATDALHLACLTSGRLVVKELTESGDTRLAKRTYKYNGGVYDRGGRGFLGFKQIEVKGPHSRIETTFYDPATRALLTTGGYAYPNAGRPIHINTQVDTPGTNGRNLRVQHYEYTFAQVIFDPRPIPLGRTFSVFPKRVDESRYDCATTVPNCSGPQRYLGGTTETFTYDHVLGTLLTRQVDHIDQASVVVQTERLVNTYHPINPDHWLMGVLHQAQVTSTISPSSMGRSVTRTVKFTPEPAVAASGFLTGEVKTVEFEPGAETSVHLMRTFGHDTRGRVTSVSDADYPTASECTTQCTGQCNTSCQGSCAGSSNPGSCMAGCMPSCMGSCVATCTTLPRVDARTTGYLYEDGDGVYATTTTDAMGNTTRVFRHVGLGLVVQTDDENALPTKFTYDSFARPRSVTEPSGQSVTVSYDDSTAPTFLGSNVTLRPADSSQRAISVHLDPFENTTSQSHAIDATRTLTKTTRYDDVGRAFETKIISRTGTTSTTLNTYTLTFDDLDRLLTDCHRTSSDGAVHCKENTYDGLTVTSKNESDRPVTTIFDTLGRQSVQRASVGAGVSNATFVYAPFNLLERESVEDGSGFSNILYDVLGRPISVARKDAGTQRLTYNAFGEVTTAFKQDSSGAARETITYGRDKLGRIRTVRSPGAGTGPGVPPAIDRQYFWDLPQSTGGTLGRGKLIDVVDSGNRTSLHFDYNSAGFVQQKSLTVFNPSRGTSGMNETFTASYTYDTQGRVDTLTYPRVPTESSALRVKYAYDSFLGTPLNIKDAANLSTTFWEVTGRNQLGQITNESMRLGSTITRITSYFLQDGRVERASIGTSTSRSQLDYTYQNDGQPRTFARSGVGGSSTSTFDNDNLGRLISWTPASGAPTVSYTYDSDGNMLARTWSGETVTYGTVRGGMTMGELTARTVTTKRGTQAAQTDTYQVDAIGRVFDTPAVSIRMTDDSRIGSVTRKSNGQVDTLVYDGLGSRVLTVLGSRGSAGTLLEFDELFELKRDGTNSTGGTEGRCRLRAGDRLVGDVIRTGTAARTAVYYLADNVHSVVAEATSSGTVTARQRRDPFGNSFTSSTTPFLPSDPVAADPDGSGRLGFGSHDRDKGWGLVDMLARAYSPRLGRFISPDFIVGNVFDRRDHNPFAYVHNSPTSDYDPFGYRGGGGAGGAGGGSSGAGGYGGSGYGNALAAAAAGGGGSGGQTGTGAGGGKGTSGHDDGSQTSAGGSAGQAGGEQPTSGTPGGGGAKGASSDAGGKSATGGSHGSTAPSTNGTGNTGSRGGSNNTGAGGSKGGGATGPSSTPEIGGTGGSVGHDGRTGDRSGPPPAPTNNGSAGAGPGSGYPGNPGTGGWGGGTGGGGTGGQGPGAGQAYGWLAGKVWSGVSKAGSTVGRDLSRTSTIDSIVGGLVSNLGNLHVSVSQLGQHGQMASWALGLVGFSVGKMPQYGHAVVGSFNTLFSPLSPQSLAQGVSDLGSLLGELSGGFGGSMEGGGQE